MGVGNVGNGRQNTWNFKDLLNGTPGRGSAKNKPQQGGISIDARESAVLSLLSIKNQTRQMAVSYSKAAMSQQEQKAAERKAQQTGKKDPEYNHKKFSRKMKNAKTAQSMQSVLADIRATIADLKAKQATGEYDEEEIAAAILHAELMEACAMKRIDHLEQEELAQRKIKREEFEELMEDKESEEDAVLLLSAAEEGSPEAVQDQAETERQMQEAEEEMQRLQEEMARQMQEEMEEMMAQMQEENPLDALDDMAKVLSGSVSEEDLDEMKKKHRAAEDMASTRADMEYLKMKFDRLQREREALKSGAKAVAAMGRSASPAPQTFADSANIISGAVKAESIKTAYAAASLSAPASDTPAGNSIDING